MALTQEQLKERRSGIGGSDVAAIIGVSPFATAYDVYMSKVEGAEREASEAMEWGNRLERVIAEAWAEKNGKKLINVLGLTRANAELPSILLANPDFVIADENAGLEVKMVGEYAADDWGDEGTDQIPEYYLTQVLHYITVMGWDRCYVAALIGGNKLRSYTVSADKDLQAELVDAAVRFWKDHVEPRVPPVRDVKTLNRAWKKTAPASKVEASALVAADVQALAQAKARLAAAEKDAEVIEARVKEAIADNEELVYEGKVIATWKFNKSSFRPDLSLLDADTIKKITVEVPGSRVLRLKKGA